MNTQIISDAKTVDLNNLIELDLGESTRGMWNCPFHDDSTPSFGVYQHRDGHQAYNCFGCGANGDAIDWMVNYRGLTWSGAVEALSGPITPSGITKPAPPKKAKPQIRTDVLPDLVKVYYDNLNSGIEYWLGQGLYESTIHSYKLGFAPTCPLCKSSPSYVIPVFHSGTTVSIRHRLANPNGRGKYLPEMAGLPPQPFNVDTLWTDSNEIPFGILDPGEALIVEGEVKSMVLNQWGYPNMGLPGLNTWRDEWVKYFNNVNKVWLVFDPPSRKNRHQMETAINRIGNTLTAAGITTYIASIVAKPDDYFVKYKGTVKGFNQFLSQSRVYRGQA